MRYCYIPLVAKVMKLMWHGTGSVNLRSILKQGLTVNIKDIKKNFDTNSYVSAIHKGIYVTSSMKMAYKDYALLSAKTYHCNPVLVLCSISMDQENVKLDEDYLSDFIPNLFMDLEGLDDYSKQKKLAYAYKVFTKFLFTTFPTVPKERFNYLLNSKELRRYLTNLVNLSLQDDGLDKVLLIDKKVTLYISNEIGKLSQLIHKTNSDIDFIGNAVNYSITTPIKYKGSKRIVAIFEQIGEDKEGQNIFKQVYGNKEYKKYFIHEWVRSVRVPLAFEH